MKTKNILTGFLALLASSVILTSAFAESKNPLKDSDTWLQAELATTYALNRHLGPFAVDTDVRSKVAYLSGTVETSVQRDLAGEIAKSIDGISSVENNIKVEKTTASARPASANRSFGQIVEDLTTTASIKTKLLTDSNVHGLAINVDTDRSAVTLSGTVGSDAERQLAEKIAENTSGVEGVKNMLKVSPSKKEG
jgi:hyperosmotically inducible protein